MLLSLDEYRDLLGWSHNEAARQLEISINTWRKHVHKQAQPRYLRLAMAALYHRLAGPN